MFKTIKKVLKSIGWGIVALFSPKMAIESCAENIEFKNGELHKIDRFQEPAPEKIIGFCSICNKEFVKGDTKFQCDCGHSTCEECNVECGNGECMFDGCKKCMYHNAVLDEWFCITTGWQGIQKGQVESECMAEHLSVAEVIISRKD